MGRWLLVRLGRAALAAWGITSLVFVLLHLLPLPLEELALGDADNLSHSTVTLSAADRAAALVAVQHRLGVDAPVFYVTRSAARWQWHGTHNLYHRWLAQLLRGQLGHSYHTGQPVATMLTPALATTLPLMAATIGLTTAVAIGLALLLAAGPARGWRVAVRTGLAALQAVPLFALALGLLLLLANPDVLNVLPANGMELDYLPHASWHWLLTYAAHLVLPLLCLVLVNLPELVLPLEAALRNELAADYASTARAKGLSGWQVAYRHALPNALLPLLATFVGLLPALVAGAVVVEALFALPGTGRLLAEAAATHDYPLVIAGVLLAATARLLAWLLADALYFWADPRLRPTS
ncbi:MAG: ABC transporter permease subunit [Janthinobacterium lividum]